jgi:hypothetical protein
MDSILNRLPYSLHQNVSVSFLKIAEEEETFVVKLTVDADPIPWQIYETSSRQVRLPCTTL